MEVLVIVGLILVGAIALGNSTPKTDESKQVNSNRDTYEPYEKRFADAEINQICKADADYEQVYEDDISGNIICD